MRKFDIEVKFETSGKNGFGESETLGMSTVYTVEAETQTKAVEIAKSKVKLEIIGVSVCEVTKEKDPQRFKEE